MWNSYTPHYNGYNANYRIAWCSETVSACAVAVGCTKVVPVMYESGQQVKWFEERNQFHKDQNYWPSMGDIIYFDWCGLSVQHVGMVEKVNPLRKTITTIEGNVDGRVIRRTIHQGDDIIYGYAVPDYNSLALPFKSAKAKKVVDKAKSWIGKGSEDGFNKSLINYYNRKIDTSNKATYSDAWSAIMISVVADKCKVTDKMPVAKDPFAMLKKDRKSVV